MANLLIAGHFGCGNLGDDAILVGFAHGLHDSGMDVTVLSGAPEDTYRLYGYRSIPRKDMKAVAYELTRADALVFAGGSVFQDSTSLGSVMYYAKLVKMAKKAGKRVYMLGQGVGPLKSFMGKRAAAGAFNAAEITVVRDPTSKVTLQSIGVKTPIKVGADLAFLLPDKVNTDDVHSFTVGDMRTIGIAPRPFGKDKRAVAELFGELCRLLFQSKMMPVLVEMDRNFDGPLIEQISKHQGGKIPDLRKQQTPMQIQGRLSRMDGVIAMRLHAGILATTVGIPPLMVSYDPKVAAFSKMLDMGPALTMDNLTASRLFETYIAFQKDRERNVKILLRKRDEFRNDAELSIAVLREGLASRAGV